LQKHLQCLLEYRYFAPGLAPKEESSFLLLGARSGNSLPDSRTREIWLRVT
jgi:hypothetical protein